VSDLVLVAEDEEPQRLAFCQFLRRAGYEAEGAPDGEAALARVLETDVAVVIADIRMPKMDGITLLRRIVAERPETFVIVVTAYASVDSAIEALRLGAYDYLFKPVVPEDVLSKLKKLMEFSSLRQEVLRLRRDLHRRLGFQGIVGSSPPMHGVFELVEKVAPTPSSVLVTGESGTGKELVARAIHARSSLSERELIAVNMAAIPEDLVEAQLFGHEKGAFTGADRRRDGVLRSVRGGTVFLDEVGDLPLGSQAKLLRAIESREVLPVGAERPVPAEFRLITATNRDLKQRVDEGQFRADLYFRLNVFEIKLPTLRERREDIPDLVFHFVLQHALALGRKPPRVSNAAMRLLLTYAWPGNVRELSNLVERATILAGDCIEPDHLPAELRTMASDAIELRAAVARFERDHIAGVLSAMGGNRDRAAESLGIDPTTLYRKLAKYRT
jgi:DNA-binding NtrC family response regulator